MGIFGSQDPYEQEGLFKPEDVTNYYGDKFYFVGADFWSKKDKSDFGMLDGYMETHEPDLKYSREILEKYINNHNLGNQHCVEFGAGIGRITKSILIEHFKEIDLIDPVKGFLEVAEKNIGNSVKLNLFPIGAQNWKAECNYDCFWVQWTIMFLTDDDAVNLLKDCKNHLNKNGKIFVKENGINDQDIDDDTLAFWTPEDHSFSRSHKSYIELFNRAGLTIIEDLIQPEWDEELFPLFFFVLC